MQSSSRDVAALRCLNCCREQQRLGCVTMFELLLRTAETWLRHDVRTAVASSRDLAASRCLNCCCEQQRRVASRYLNCCNEQQGCCGVTSFELLLRTAGTFRRYVV